jgi:hypothetical protein
MRALPGFFVLTLSVAACGGSTTTDLFQDASATNDGSSNDSGTKDSGTIDARPDGPAPNCTALVNEVANKRDKALECNPNGGAIQCNALVPDLCCPISVTDPTRKDVQEFAAAVDAVKKAGCTIGCPAIPCPAQPSGKCDGKTGKCL